MEGTILRIACDGACKGNQFTENRGGWGVVLQYGEHEKELSGGEKNTTNNRMELTAVIKGMEAVKTPLVETEVLTDSHYVVKAVNAGWLDEWQKNGWKTSKKKPVENQDLWKQFLVVKSKFGNIVFTHVKGHNGHPLNERADKLAQAACIVIDGEEERAAK